MVWETKGVVPGGYWRAPSGLLHIIDIRPLPAQGMQETVDGVALIGMPDDITLGDDYRLFGKGAGLTDIVPQESDRAVFSSLAGVKTVDGSTLAEWMFTLLTRYVDPFGDTAARPLMPGTDRLLRACGIRKVFDASDPDAALQIAIWKDDYRKTRELALDGKIINARGIPDTEAHRKVLDSLGQKLGIARPQDVFIPDDLPVEEPLPHDTTITDSFNRADQTNLGTSSEGWSWSVSLVAGGQADIASNQAAQNVLTVATQCVVRAESDLSSSDNYSQTSVINRGGTGDNVGALCRKDSTSTLSYYLNLVVNDSSNIVLGKYVSGSFTQLGSTTAVTVSLPQPIKVNANGSLVKGFWDSVEKISITDTAVATGVRCGMRYGGVVGATGGILDAFEAADLAAATIRRRLPLLGAGA